MATSATVVEPVLDDAAAALATRVNRNRARLLKSRTAVTVAQISSATGRSHEAVRRWLNRLEADGSIVAVRHDGSLLVPTFQLTDAFELDEGAAAIVGQLVEFGMGPWAVWDWAHAHNGWIDDAPAAALADSRVADVQRAVDGLLQR